MCDIAWADSWALPSVEVAVSASGERLARAVTYRGDAMAAALLATSQIHAQPLRCEFAGQPTEWMQVSPRQGWREWDGQAWGPALCGRQMDGAQVRERWLCRFGRQHHTLTYTATDRRSGGVYRWVETLDIASGAYHRRIDDGTYVPDGGKRLALDFHGRCAMRPDGPPPADPPPTGITR